jgi:hypothetical protein
MNWGLSLRYLVIALASVTLLACQQEDVRVPSWLSQAEFRKQVGDFEFLEEKLNSPRALDRAYAGLKLVRSKVKDDTEYGEGLRYLGAIEKDLESLGIDSLIAEANYLKAQIYWSLGLDKRSVLEFSQMAIDKAVGGRKFVYLGNHSTYLLELGKYQEVIDLQGQLQEVYLANGNNISEAMAVEAFAYFGLAQQMELKAADLELEIDFEGNTSMEYPEGIQSKMDMALSLMRSSLDSIDGIPDVIDKEHVYLKALALDVLSKEERYQCLQFAKENNLYKLETALRAGKADFLEFGESREEGLLRFNEALAKGLERERELKQQIANYEARRAQIDREFAAERAALRQNSYLTLLFAALFILLISIIFFRAQNSANQAKLEKQDSSILLANYKNRIRPHFLFNQLNNVNGFISQEKWDEAQEYIGLLSVHLRSILENSEEDKTVVQLEFDRIKNYVALQQKSSFAHVDFQCELDMKSANIKIPSGLLQPLIENSYKYAGNASEKNSWIKLTGKTIGDALTITVEDSGYGFLERVPGTGSGLSLVKERIEFNKSKSRRPELWGIEIDFNKRKSTVKLTMPSKLV